MLHAFIRGNDMHEELSNEALMVQLHVALGSSNQQDAQLLCLIGEVDSRKLYLPLGYSSMYTFCVEELNLSEASARKRITAAKLARKFPVLLDHLASGALHLCGAALLAPHLTPDNGNDLIGACLHQSKRRIELMLASRFGAEDGADGCAPGRMDPIGNKRHRVRATFDQSQHDKVEYAKALLSHRLPGATLEQVLDAALDALIAQEEKRAMARTTTARTARPSAIAAAENTQTPSRRVPNEVRRAVVARDGWRCSYVGPGERQCDGTHFLELDHIRPFALGGDHSLENLRLRCRSHNFWHAQETYGATFMKRWSK